MKTRDKIMICIAIGLIAALIAPLPMWWGVLFSPITQQLTTEPVTEALTQGLCWQTDGIVFRLRVWDLLMEFFSRF